MCTSHVGFGEGQQVSNEHEKPDLLKDDDDDDDIQHPPGHSE